MIKVKKFNFQKLGFFSFFSGLQSSIKIKVCGSRMGKALGTNREHERSTYQGIDVVAAPATVKVSFLTEARIPAT